MEIDWVSAGISSGALGAFFIGLRFTVSQVKTDQRKDKKGKP